MNSIQIKIVSTDLQIHFDEGIPTQFPTMFRMRDNNPLLWLLSRIRNIVLSTNVRRNVDDRYLSLLVTWFYKAHLRLKTARRLIRW